MTHSNPDISRVNRLSSEDYAAMARSDDPSVRMIARKKRAITTSDLVAIFRKENVTHEKTCESDALDTLASLPVLTTEQENFELTIWHETKCELSRDRLLTSSVALQFRYLLKRGNFGRDFLDILHDAFIDTAARLDTFCTDSKTNFRPASLLSVLRARTTRKLTMSRPVSSSLGIPNRTAMNAILRFEIDEVEGGTIDAEMIASSTGLAMRDLNKITQNVGFLTAKDVCAEDHLTVDSHEDKTIARVDAEQLPRIIAQALDRRAQDIIFRRWLKHDCDDAEVLAQDWGITPERVRQIERQSLKDMKSLLDGEQTTRDIDRLRERIKQNRHKISVPRRMRTDRRAVKGVNLEAAKNRLDKILPEKSAQVLRARYFGEDRVPTYREICPDLDLLPPAACVLENEAFNVLRAYFPAHA